MLGGHCIRTWSSTQGALALSSAEAEFYAMLDGVLHGKGILNLAADLGVKLSDVLHLSTDSAAAKSFVAKRGLGGMRHLQLRDLWLQQEVAEGRVAVEKVPELMNPADLMTKYLSKGEIAERLWRMHMRLTWTAEPA